MRLECVTLCFSPCFSVRSHHLFRHFMVIACRLMQDETDVHTYSWTHMARRNPPIPVSHLTPVYPRVQWHKNEFSWSSHMLLCWQGDERHSSTSTMIENNNQPHITAERYQFLMVVYGVRNSDANLCVHWANIGTIVLSTNTFLVSFGHEKQFVTVWFCHSYGALNRSSSGGQAASRQATWPRCTYKGQHVAEAQDQQSLLTDITLLSWVSWWTCTCIIIDLISTCCSVLAWLTQTIIYIWSRHDMETTILIMQWLKLYAHLYHNHSSE